MHDDTVISITIPEIIIKGVAKFADVQKAVKTGRWGLGFIRIKKHPVKGITFAATDCNCVVISRYVDGLMMGKDLGGGLKPVPADTEAFLSADPKTLHGRLMDSRDYTKGVRVVDFFSYINCEKKSYMNRHPEDMTISHDYPYPNIEGVMITDPIQVRAECKAGRCALLDRRYLGKLSNVLIPHWENTDKPQGVEFFSVKHKQWDVSINYILSDDNNLMIGVMPIRRGNTR